VVPDAAVVAVEVGPIDDGVVALEPLVETDVEVAPGEVDVVEVRAGIDEPVGPGALVWDGEVGLPAMPGSSVVVVAITTVPVLAVSEPSPREVKYQASTAAAAITQRAQAPMTRALLPMVLLVGLRRAGPCRAGPFWPEREGGRGGRSPFARSDQCVGSRSTSTNYRECRCEVPGSVRSLR